MRETVCSLLQRGFWAKGQRKSCLSLHNLVHRLKGSKRLILTTHEAELALLREALPGFLGENEKWGLSAAARKEFERLMAEIPPKGSAQ